MLAVILSLSYNRPMFICSCRAVTDRQIRESIESGNDDLQAVVEDTGAGECCGSCHEDILQMILDSLPPQEAEVCQPGLMMH